MEEGVSLTFCGLLVHLSVILEYSKIIDTGRGGAVRRRFFGFPPKRLLGLSLFSAGCGMLVVLVIPWWGFIAAVILVAVGGFLLFSDKILLNT